jgi:hypothetical protein
MFLHCYILFVLPNCWLIHIKFKSIITDEAAIITKMLLSIQEYTIYYLGADVWVYFGTTIILLSLLSYWPSIIYKRSDNRCIQFKIYYYENFNAYNIIYIYIYRYCIWLQVYHIHDKSCFKLPTFKFFSFIKYV